MAKITQTITQFPPAPNSATDSAQTFNSKANAFVGHQSGTYVGEVNAWATQANAVRNEINGIASNIPAGSINDATKTGTSTWSSNKINALTFIDSGNGYVKYPDGTMMQWGIITGSATGNRDNIFGTTAGKTYYADKDTTYPIIFVGVPPVVTVTPMANGYVDRFVGTTSATLYIVGQANFGVTMWYKTVPKVSWIAIGRWK